MSDNVTVEEIDEMFAARVPARKFRKYQCQGPLATGAAQDSESVDGVEAISRKVSTNKGRPTISESRMNP